MSDPADLALAERCLAALGGAAEAQVTIVRERSLTCRFARSTPTQATAVDDLSVEVLVVIDGHTTAASTNATDPDGLAAVAERALRAARSSAALAGEPGAYPGLPAPAPAPALPDGWDQATAALDPAGAHRALAEAFGAAERAGAEAFGIWTAGAVSTTVASSTGTAAQDAVTDAHMRVICRREDGRSGFAAHTAVAAAALDGSAIAERAGARLTDTEPSGLPPGEYPVVLGAEAVGDLLAFLGVLAFNGLAHAEGRGALVDRLGTRVAAPCVQLGDAPRRTGGLPRTIDAEGVPKSELALIRDGVAQAVVHDTRTAARAGGDARSTGHALTGGGNPEGAVPTNLHLAGGEAADEQALAAPIERGLYVTRLWYVNPVQPQRTLLTGMTRDGTFLIEDGRIGRPLHDVRFTDEVLRILDATEALTAVPTLVTEADLYGRRFAYGSVCPSLRAQGFRVTGGAES
ncbi:MAG TPA: metallopeptidase TldD-related protein [Solirubrobacteraceae bacterium]|nr:metallopeptidase TldD-related protein [Solirubrobacteraceae bacterium]